MAHGGNPRIEHKRPWPKFTYARTILPTYASAGGKAHAEYFARLPEVERRRLCTLMAVGCARANARRYGHPEPVFVEANMKQLPGGGYVVDESKPMPPLRPELGGDGRTLADALHEAKRAQNKDHVHIASLRLAILAEKHRARLIKLGYEIAVDGTITKPKRKAQRSA
jgi:hypothetical protein